jgi:fructose-specific phosphotransferase system IIC component
MAIPLFNMPIVLNGSINTSLIWQSGMPTYSIYAAEASKFAQWQESLIIIALVVGLIAIFMNPLQNWLKNRWLDLAINTTNFLAVILGVLTILSLLFN